MVARLKLKEIDGRAPPGVSTSWPQDSAPKSGSARRVVPVIISQGCLFPLVAFDSGDTLKLSGNPLRRSTLNGLPKGRPWHGVTSVVQEQCERYEVTRSQAPTRAGAHGEGSET